MLGFMGGMVSRDAADRFTERVEDYRRYRPGYPVELIGWIHRETGLDARARVADIGSGTGISSALFLKAGHPVAGVEPNAAMRRAAELWLAGFPGFRSVDGRAQATTLPSAEVDLIVAAQAFHWFDTAETRAEFSRILKPGGWIALIWNERITSATPFLRDYENLLLRFGTDYSEVRHENTGADSLGRFFIGERKETAFPNRQELDFEGLRGRLLSCSYVPLAGHPDHEPMIAELRRVFDRHQTAGRVAFDYVTRVYLGH